MGPVSRGTTAVPRALLLLVVTTFAALALVVGVPPGPAQAQTTACEASPENGCLEGNLRGTAGPIEGVSITVERDGEVVEATTDANGDWSAPVTENGTYTVTVDVGTLPEGEQLADPDDNPRDLRAVVGATRQVVIELGTPSDEPPSGESGEDPVPGGGDGGDDVIGDDVDATAGGSGLGTRILQQTAAGIRFGLVIALASVGLSLVYGTTGLSSFAHGEQVTLGALLTYVFAMQQGWPLIPAIILSVLLCAATGWIQDKWLWQPLRRMRVGLVQGMIVTIGLALALQHAFQLIFGGGTVRVLDYIPGSWNIGPVRLNIPSYIAMGISVVALLAVAYFLVRTRTGRATRAVADNPALAAASGIDVDRIIRLVWVMATGLAGLAGVLFALIFNGANWMLGMQMLLLMFAAVTLGGLGTAFGALVGSIIIGLVVELSNLIVPTDLKYASALLILILVLLVRPQGILGRAERVG